MIVGRPLGGGEDRLEGRTVEVGGRRCCYLVGGRGLPVVFLHGWGLGCRSYEGALGELVGRGCRVVAPALPGFGGTAGLPSGQRTIAGYAAWVDAFLDAVHVDDPALVVGHSFGGGVAIGLAHDAPERIRQLVLINSIGHPAGSRGPTLTAAPVDRPVWPYGPHVANELWSPDGYRIMMAISADVLYNVVANPVALVEIGLLARGADLTAELADLRRWELPVLVLWSQRDGVIPLSSFDALCAAIGTDGRVLEGGHSWLLASPGALSEVLDNEVRVQVAEHELHGVRTTTAALRELLRPTTLPSRVVNRLLSAASVLWMMSERPSVLAADLALCHPPLASGEVRAVARPMDEPATFRLTVVAADRPGLLADTANALSAEGLTVLSASVTTWADDAIALHALTLTSTTAANPDWDALGVALRHMESDRRPAVRYARTGRATVTTAPSGPGRTVVKVIATDGLGLLATISRWFAEHEVNIEAAEISSLDGTATDRFVVAGAFEPAALAAHLSPAPKPACGRLCLPPVCWLATARNAG